MSTSSQANTRMTNAPWAKSIVATWPIIKTLVGALVLMIVFWLSATLYTREEGEALEKIAATKVELKEVQQDVERVEIEIHGIKTEVHGFKIEQRHTNKQIATIIRLMEIEHSRSP